MESYSLSNALPAFIEYGTQLDLEFFLVIQVVLGMFGALREVPVYNLPLFLFGLYAYQNRDSIDPLKQFSMFTALSIILDITWLLLNELSLGYVLTIVSLILKPLTLVSVFHLLKLRREPFGTNWSSLGPYGGDGYGRYQSLGDPLLDVDERDAQEVHIPRHDRYPSSIRRYSSNHSHQSHNSHHSHNQHTPPQWNSTNSSAGSGIFSGDHRGIGGRGGAAALATSHGSGGTHHSPMSYPGSIRSGHTPSSLKGGDGVLSDSASGNLRKEEESGFSPVPTHQQQHHQQHQQQHHHQAQYPVSTASSLSATAGGNGAGYGMAPMSPGRTSGASGRSTSPGGGGEGVVGTADRDASEKEDSDGATSEKKRKPSRKHHGVNREDYQEF
ncbi:hypothetical protein BGZ73_002200 [Actinomortierella ambigua]|nr:hypothetical protein BGZ73_002200 [Actinomortierella ambigua]